MSKTAKYKAKREKWLLAYREGRLPFQMVEKKLDLAQLANLRASGLLDSPSPKNQA